MSRRLIDGQLPVKGEEADIGGRQPLFITNPNIEKTMVSALRIGATPVRAARLADVGYATFRDWSMKAKLYPESIYGVFISKLLKAIAEYEIRELTVFESFAQGRAAEYEKDPVLDEKGKPVFDKDGNVIMTTARFPDGRPILKKSEIKPDWRASEARISRRLPKEWASVEDVDSIFDINATEHKEVDLPAEESVKATFRKLKDFCE